MKLADNYHIECDKYQWILVQSTVSDTLSEKTGEYPISERKTYYATLEQLARRLVALEVKGLDTLTDVLDCMEDLTSAILGKLTSDLSTGSWRLIRHGEELEK